MWKMYVSKRLAEPLRRAWQDINPTLPLIRGQLVVVCGWNASRDTDKILHWNLNRKETEKQDCHQSQSTG